MEKGERGLFRQENLVKRFLAVIKEFFVEIRISVQELSRALTMIQGILSRKATMPILANVHLQASKADAAVYLSSTDLDVSMKLKKGCEILDEGAACVSGRSLLDIVKVLPGPDVTLKSQPNYHLNIKSGRTIAKLVGLPPSEFPNLPSVSGVRFQAMDGEKFVSMLNRTLYSASSDDNRYNLTGVFFEPQRDDPSSIVLVSTDGHRLSRVRETFEGNFGELEPVTLPRKGLVELVKMLEANNESKPHLEIGILENHAMFMVNDAFLAMRLIDGRFPDYHQVIPKLADKILRASRSDFLMGLKRVAVLASEKNQSVKIKTRDGELSVSCVNPEMGEVTDDVPVEYNGPDIEIGFNARYIIEALNSIADNNVMVKFTDPLSPTLITGMGDERHQCVIMPMRM